MASTRRIFLPSSNKTSLTYDSKQRIPWGVAAVQAPQVWKYAKGKGVRIGIVDTGADYEHPDIKHSLRKGVNLLHRLSPAVDDNGHGTHIAGIIAASCKTGIYGTAPNAQLYPVKAFDSDGSAYISDILLAIHWCIANHMHIINMSFGMSEYNAALLQAVKAANRQGILIIASSGNNGHASRIDYPARFPQVIAVGAINKRGGIAAFSNRGQHVDIYAPGESIYSTWPDERYNELNGTSMATAHVSGALALLMAKRPRTSHHKLKTVLIASSIPFDGTKSSSAGKLNIVRAFRMLTSGSTSCSQISKTTSVAGSVRRAAAKSPKAPRKKSSRTNT